MSAPLSSEPLSASGGDGSARHVRDSHNSHNSHNSAAPLWTPSAERVAAANLTAFRLWLNARTGQALGDYEELHAWSVAHSPEFWAAVWDYAGVVGDGPGTPLLSAGDQMPGAQWFPAARLNFAENLLRRNDDGDALVFWGEDVVRRRLSWRSLLAAVSRVQQALQAVGVGPGDRVAAYMPNMPETVIAMLAVASLGATWSSCSPDFGVQGVVDRFGQIAPTVLFAPDSYRYAGKSIPLLERVVAVLRHLPTVKRAVIVAYDPEQAATTEALPEESGIAPLIRWADFLAPYAAAVVRFTRLPFNHPLYILYSSGTTGKPKCIVHGAGGTLLQHLKEHRLHSDVRPGDRVFYFTTCGWMMWNWLISGLASEATLLLYDGSPFHPSGEILFDYADAENMTFFGTSAKFLSALEKSGLEPGRTHRLDHVRTLASTGSPLAPESFDYVYRSLKADLHLASISGGTDIVSCFVLGNPTGPVWRSEIQCRGLGMAVEAVDDDGQPVRGRKGELVCCAPFPSMPIGFWNDLDGSRYHAAYFQRFPGLWHHGDCVEITAHGGMIIYGRSDAVLNPGGVRIGTAEIYNQVELLPEILESLAIGQEWEGDVRVVLFVVLRDGLILDEALIARIRNQIRENTTPRHVPARIVQVTDIPRTRSGKITELAVRDAVHGRPVKNTEALANPQALEQFRNRSELKA